jgi:hypothetical protein
MLQEDKEGRKGVFATNQKTPMQSKNTNKEMKENYQASGAPSSAALISGLGMSGSSMSLAGRMNGAPQKGNDDSSIKGDSSNGHVQSIDNKFGDDIQNTSQAD